MHKKKKQTYPWQDLGFEDLEGEQWEDIPSLDGYYRISNFGRTRRLAREILCSNGQLRRIKEKIISPFVELPSISASYISGCLINQKWLKDFCGEQ